MFSLNFSQNSLGFISFSEKFVGIIVQSCLSYHFTTFRSIQTQMSPEFSSLWSDDDRSLTAKFFIQQWALHYVVADILQQVNDDGDTIDKSRTLSSKISHTSLLLSRRAEVDGTTAERLKAWLGGSHNLPYASHLRQLFISSRIHFCYPYRFHIPRHSMTAKILAIIKDSTTTTDLNYSIFWLSAAMNHSPIRNVSFEKFLWSDLLYYGICGVASGVFSRFTLLCFWLLLGYYY